MLNVLTVVQVAIKRLHAHILSEEALEQFKKEIVMMLVACLVNTPD